MSDFDFSPLVDAGSTPVVVDGLATIDHEAVALSRLVSQFQQPSIKALLTALVSGCQPVEEALQQLLLLRTIEDGEGEQLNVIGRKVGQDRLGLADVDYRRYLRAKVKTNRSRTTHEELLAIAHLILNDPSAGIELINVPPAALVMRVLTVDTTTTTAGAMITMLRLAKKAGVRLILEYSESTPANTFRLDSGPGLDVGHLAGTVE